MIAMIAKVFGTMNDRVIEIIEILFAVEILEYHDKNWLGAGDVSEKPTETAITKRGVRIASNG